MPFAVPVLAYANGQHDGLLFLLNQTGRISFQKATAELSTSDGNFFPFEEGTPHLSTQN